MHLLHARRWTVRGRTVGGHWRAVSFGLLPACETKVRPSEVFRPVGTVSGDDTSEAEGQLLDCCHTVDLRQFL